MKFAPHAMKALCGRIAIGVGTLATLTTCTSTARPLEATPLAPHAAPIGQTPAPVIVAQAIVAEPIAQPAVVHHTGPISIAPTPMAYRKDAASHLYGLHKSRIFKGRMPPLLYAVGVLQVEIGELGTVSGVSWMRKPSHAPEVVEEIERMVRAAAPYPAPIRMGGVTYTDTWLWDKSGHFQLDTLTEGQL